MQQLNPLAADWAALMAAVLWQSTLLIAVVTLIVQLLHRSSPALRYWIWQIVALKLLLMPFWTHSVPLPALFETAAAPETTFNEPAMPLVPVENMPDGMAGVERSEPPPPGSPVNFATDPGRPPWYARITWQSWLLAAWAMIIVAQLTRVVLLRLRLARLLRKAVPATGEPVILLDEAARLLGLRKIPRLVLTEYDCSPFVCGIRHPVVVLPQSLTASLEPDRIRQVLLHELAHVKRRDLIWSWIPELARIVYFFHPLVYWVAFRLRLDRELACDQLAMAHTGQSAADYADTLVQVVAHASEPAPLKSAAASSAALDGEARSAKQKARE